MTDQDGQSVRSVDERGEPAQLGEYNGMEIYPMPMFATITTADGRSLANWYVQVLGFKIVFAAPVVGGQPAMVHLRRRKYQDILIVPGPAATAIGSSLTLSFHTDDVDALAEHAHAAAGPDRVAIEGPINTPWNTRDLRVTDPIGNRLVFTGQNHNADPQQVERMRKMLDGGRKS